METTDEKIMTALSDWGCDVADAMPRFLDRKDLYCRLLAQVPAETGFEALGTALEAGDVQAAFEQAHGLKGVLGNMGLTPMYETVCRIVEPLRAGTAQGVEQDYRRLMEMRETLCRILRQTQA